LSSASGNCHCVGGSTSGVNNVNKDDYNNRRDDNDDCNVNGVHDDLDDVSGCSMNEYSADEYPLNEWVSFFMEHCPITSSNHSAGEAAYLVEALTSVCSARAMKNLDIALKVEE
jgi:hypothetical protein